MADEFGFGVGTTGFSSTVHDNILKTVVATLRAGLVSLPKGAVVPARVIGQHGSNFTMRSTAYPDLAVAATTAPLTEGVAPTALKLGIDTQDWTVQQMGAHTKVTDIAKMQSPHNLDAIATDKIARLAADTLDKIGRDALLAITTTNDYGSFMDSQMLLDWKALAQEKNFEPIPGVGYYLVTHPAALRALEGEDGTAGYTDVTAQVKGNDLTKGVVGQYRGVTFLVSSKFVDSVGDGTGTYPVFIFGANSIAAGDLGSLEFIHWSAPGPGNELGQLSGVGFKGVLGAEVLELSEETSGAAVNATAVPRVLRFGVTTGINGF